MVWHEITSGVLVCVHSARCTVHSAQFTVHSVLFFAIASGPAPYPTQLRDQKVNNGRRNMVLHSSKDEGAHWSALPLSTGLAGYVAMTTLPASGKLALMWETATDDECIGACALSFAIVDPRPA